MNDWPSETVSKIIWVVLALFASFLATKVGRTLGQKLNPSTTNNVQKSKSSKRQKIEKKSAEVITGRQKYRSYVRLSFYVLLNVLLLFIAHRGYFSDVDYIIFGLSFAILFLLPIIELFRSVDYSFLDSLLLIILAIRLDTEFIENGERVFSDLSNLSLENPFISFLQGALMIGLVTELLQFSILVQNVKKTDAELIWKYYSDPSIDRTKRILWDSFIFIAPLLPVLFFPFVPNKENAPKWVLITWYVTAFLSLFFPLLLVTNRNKLEQPKVRILFRSLETLVSVILLSCGILYVLYGFNLIELIAVTISQYYPGISRTVSIWISKLFGYAVSGVVGNIAYDLIKKIIKYRVNSQKMNENPVESSREKTKTKSKRQLKNRAKR